MCYFFRNGSGLQSLDVHDLYGNIKEFPMVSQVFNILLSIPPTSVSCETTFSQMKLIKTSRRTKLSSSSLNSLLLVKLESPEITDFDPSRPIEIWMVCYNFTKLVHVQVHSNFNKISFTLKKIKY